MAHNPEEEGKEGTEKGEGEEDEVEEDARGAESDRGDGKEMGR